MSHDANSKQQELGTLEKARIEAAKILNIDLSEPKQEKRIAALELLYKKYSNQIGICGFIYQNIIDCCNELVEVYEQKQSLLDDLKQSKGNLSLLKVRLEGINYQYSEFIRTKEEKIDFNKQLLNAYENKYVNNVNIKPHHKQELKRLEDICWDNWLKALDVNRELRNTIIGFENRKALLALSKAYIDYYIFVDIEVKKCFEELKQLKKDGIFEYYEILRRYELPINKKIDFKMFLQKKIESKLSDALEIKSLFGPFLDSQRKHIEDSIQEIKEQFERDQKEIISIINYYKNFLLQKQVLFTNEAEKLVLYLKKRYVEKIDYLCSRFQMYNSELTVTSKTLSKSDLRLLKKIFKEEFDAKLNRLKMEYSKKFIPLLDNFWHIEQLIGKTYALDEQLFTERCGELKKLKNINVSSLIEKFKEEKEKIEQLFKKKIDLTENISQFSVDQFNSVLSKLKKDCEVICCEIMNLNNRFWTKTNAEFNCEARKLLIKLNHQYAPWIKSWKTGDKSWMHEYLLTNLNQEALKAVGHALEDFSPESELYIRASEALLQYNELSRKIYRERDHMESEQLMKLNSVPTVDLDSLLTESNKKLDELKRKYESYWKNYNDFYSSLPSS